jgi:topoisomerase-4 subunit A
MKDSDMQPAEPITVVLSQAGWIRAAKGHEVDPTSMSYKANDSYQSHCLGKSNQRVYVLDSTGRSYALAAANLPSARGQGEPLTSKLTPPAGSRFVEVLMGEDRQPILLASQHGYGFISQLDSLESNAKAGKSVVNLPERVEMLPVLRIPEGADRVAVLASSGRLLVYPLADLPVMSKGKGNKLIQLEEGEVVKALIALPPQAALQLICGSRPLTLKDSDLAHYSGKRGQRGHLLPRGYQKASHMQLV